MARRGAAFGAVLLLAALLVPAASGQAPQLPAVASRHQVVSIGVPIGPDGHGSLQVPVAGGVLDIDLVPAPLAGAGGTVDAEAYVAYVTLLLADGTSLPLPSMVVLAEDVAVAGDLAQALADLSTKAQELHDAILGLQAEPADDVLGQAEALQQQVAALAEQAAWILAFADALAGVATEGAAEMLAILGGTLATLEAAVALLEDGLDRAAAQAEGLPLPEEPSPSPSPSPSASPTPTPTPSPSPSSSSTSSPSPLADLSAAEAAFDQAMAEAQAAAAEVEQQIEDVQLILEGIGGEAGQQAAEAAAMLGGALNGVAAALAGAQAEARRMQGEAEAQAAQGAAQAQDEAERLQADAEAALAAVAWATDWLEAAAEFAPTAVEGPLADAQAAVDVANRTAQRLADVVQEYSPVPAEALAEQLAQQVAAAQAAVAEAMLLAESVAGQVDPDLTIDEQGGLAVCAHAAASQACVLYRAPAHQADLGTVRLLVAVPVADPVNLDLVGTATSLTRSLTGAPSLPTSTSTPTLPPLPTGLPGPSSSSSPSASPSPSPSPSPSASPSPSPSASSSSTSASASPSATASSSASPTSSASSSSAAAAPPKLVASADQDALSLRMGEQASLVVTVRNDGGSSDVVRLTAQTNAPVALDTPTESITLAPGASGTFPVRITPHAAGSGNLQLLATGDKAGTVTDTVAVAVAAATPAAAKVSVSLQPPALAGAVGQSLAVTLRLANDGPVADRVQVAVSGAGLSAEPASLAADLEPGEVELREVRVTPRSAGEHEVLLAITSDRGAALRPIVLLDAHEAEAQGEERAEDGGSSSPAKGSPALAPLAAAAAVALAFALVRRRLR